ncbi:MAG TPA: DUF1801 domain-containing protein [Steroidobacteraceae bacterium]|jgi:uncharacterized protein YdhG (YjbR/CyaY superfamily)|nr:DUF1801 domain-containing protein [Steroidobacteraceae bacterium]
MASPKKPTTVSEYIAAAPREARARLRQMRALVAAAAPGATQGLKWGMPAFSYDRILVTFAAFKHHIGFFITPDVKRAFARELADFKTARSSVRLPFDEPLPKALIKRITAHRAREARTRDAKWRSQRPADG